jgi:hypothetical protein
VGIVTVKVRYTFLDTASGESWESVWWGEGYDGNDKAIYKAYTGALKYCLMMVFMIPTGDDPTPSVGDPEFDREERGATGGSKGARREPKSAKSAGAAPRERKPTAEEALAEHDARALGMICKWGPPEWKDKVKLGALSEQQLADLLDKADERLAAEPHATWAEALREFRGTLRVALDAKARIRTRNTKSEAAAKPAASTPGKREPGEEG